MLGGVVADGLLHIGNGDVLTVHIELSQCLKGLREGLVIEAEVAVAGRPTFVGDGLADGTQVMFHVHLHHLEDSLARTGLRRVVHAGRHGWSGTGKGLAVNSVIGDTIDGTGCLAAYADLIYFCHFSKGFKWLLLNFVFSLKPFSDRSRDVVLD